mgnify:CR=1 FL=1
MSYKKLDINKIMGIQRSSNYCFVNSAILFLYSCDEIRNYILNTNIEIIKENYELNTKDEEKKIKINKLKLKNLKFIFEKLNNSENTDEYLSDTLILEEKKQLVKNLPDIKCNGKTINMGTSWEIVKHFLDILQNNIQKIEEIFIDWHYENDILKVNYQEHFVTPFIPFSIIDSLKYNLTNKFDIKKFFNENHEKLISSAEDIDINEKKLYKKIFYNINYKTINFFIFYRNRSMDSDFNFNFRKIKLEEKYKFFGKNYNLKSILLFGGLHYWIKVKIDDKWIEINDKNKSQSSITEYDYDKWSCLLYEIENTEKKNDINLSNEISLNLLINNNYFFLNQISLLK